MINQIDIDVKILCNIWIKIKYRVFSGANKGGGLRDAYFYSNYDLPYGSNVEMIDSRSVVSLGEKFLYCRIPKSANSTVMASLHFARSGQRVTDLECLQKIKDSAFARLSQLSADEVEDLMQSFYVFTFVRNPYRRIASCYLDKIVCNKNSSQRRKVAERIGKSCDEEISIDDFLDYLEQGGLFENAHWIPQLLLLPLPRRRFNFVGKVETMNQDLPYLLERLFRAKPEALNVRPHSTSSSRLAYELSRDIRLRNRVFGLYHQDFDSFEYSKIDSIE